MAAATLTAAQTSWLQGFWSFFQGQVRPDKAGAKQDGWDAAQKTNHSGGY